MKQLASEGIVELVPYKGGTVARTSITELEETYRIQQDLEGLAAYLATPRLTRKHIAELERIHQASRDSNRDVAQWQRWNTRFHRALLENCGNRRLIKLVKGHQDQFARYWFLLLSIPGRIDESIAEHEKILAAVKAKEAARVRALMESHFEGSSKQLLEIIRNVYPSSFTH
jgi:DNA-binding GntR family transcriptional regulator